MKLEGNGSNIDQFLNDLKFIAATPDDSVDYSPDAINPNSTDNNSESLLLKDDGTVDVLANAPDADEIKAETQENAESQSDTDIPAENGSDTTSTDPVPLVDGQKDNIASTSSNNRKMKIVYVVLAVLTLLILILAILILFVV